LARIGATTWDIVTLLADERIALLIGAGASFGAWDGSAPAPPLGAQLFPALCGSFPATWGSLTHDQKELFVGKGAGISFEHGMQQLWEEEMQGKESPASVQDLIIDMAVYFSRCQLPEGVDNRYSELIACLQRYGLTGARLGVASLNYECLIEMGIGALGVAVEHAPVPPRDEAISVWKPHGACNLVALPVANGSWWEITVRSTPNMVFGNVPLVALPPAEVEPLYRSRRTVPPVVSLYAPGKHSPVVPQFIDRSRAQWTHWASDVQVVVSAGARYVPEDHHIWEGVAGGAAAIWYVGDSDSATGLKHDVGDHRVIHLGERFGDTLPHLIARLESLA
jgi:hypothetical protein